MVFDELREDVTGIGKETLAQSAVNRRVVLVFDEEQETETTSDKENTETEKTAEQGTETAGKDIAEEVSEEKE